MGDTLQTGAHVIREPEYRRPHDASVSRRMAGAAAMPRSLPALLTWLRREFDREVPDRLHNQGTEPDSALGSPALSGAFRAYLTGSALATDHDDRLDLDHRGAARRYPIHAAMTIMARKWPLSTRYLFAVIWTGCEWEDVALAWRMMPEVGHRFTWHALQHLWTLWARDASCTTAEVV